MEIENPVLGVYTVTVTPKQDIDLVDENGDLSAQDISIIVYGGRAVDVPLEVVLFEETAASEYSLAFSSAVGGVFVIERSPDLINWSTEPYEVVANKMITAVTVTATNGADSEFFRVRQIH